MKYDGEEIEPTENFIEAIKNLMRAEMEMMRIREPEYADCWAWGICDVGDLSRTNCFKFEYGGEDYKPVDFSKHEDCCIKIEWPLLEPAGSTHEK